MKSSPRLLLFFSLLLLILTSCAKQPNLSETSRYLTVTAADEDNLLSRHLPVFLIEDPQEGYNLPGTPEASVNPDGQEQVSVNPARTAIYTREQRFRTNQGTYSNLVYRLHFSETPLSILPFYIGAGKNVGLLVIITLNDQGQPLLYTTLHTCGCYLAFVPTTLMPAEAYPKNWPKNSRQSVYSQSLPAVLNISSGEPNSNTTVVQLESGTHRVMDIRRAGRNSLAAFKTSQAELHPLASLKSLPTPSGGTTSFYETTGGRLGYVKGSQKIWERLLISWWAMDWRVGEDKDYEDNQLGAPIFYTSLKPWARKDSDLRNFAAFLSYWGWQL